MVAGKKLGKKALWIGALANSFPDFDFVASFFMETHDDLLAHRGFTHSFLFTAATSFLLAWLFSRWFRKYNMSFLRWLILFGIGLFLHLLMDMNNAYGTALFLPFHPIRVSLHTLFVADPLYTIWPLAAVIALLIFSARWRYRKLWAAGGLFISTLYIFLCFVARSSVEDDIRQSIALEQLPVKRYLITPTPLNSILWFVAAEADSGYYIAHRSLFDERPRTKFYYIPRNDSLLNPLKHTDEVQDLLRFSQGWYTVEQKEDTLLFNDLRFGQIAGWRYPEEGFVFHYRIHPPGNALVVQRGRFARWDRETFRQLLRAIAGKD